MLYYKISGIKIGTKINDFMIGNNKSITNFLIVKWAFRLKEINFNLVVCKCNFAKISVYTYVK